MYVVTTACSAAYKEHFEPKFHNTPISCTYALKIFGIIFTLNWTPQSDKIKAKISITMGILIRLGSNLVNFTPQHFLGVHPTSCLVLPASKGQFTIYEVHLLGKYLLHSTLSIQHYHCLILL